MEKGYKVTEEVRRKMSKAHTGKKRPPFSDEWRKNISNGQKGRKHPHSEETKLRISLAKKGKPNLKKRGTKHTEETKRKISIAKKGVKLSLEARKNIGLGHFGLKRSIETRKKLSEAKMGEKNPQWKGGVKSFNQKIRASLEYKLWREAVFVRDNWTCVWCLQRGGELHADHIKPFAYYPELRFAIDNGRILCVSCHRKTDTWGKSLTLR